MTTGSLQARDRPAVPLPIPERTVRTGVVSILMPVYNEERHIETILRRVQDVPVPKEIVVVDDGSTDSTARILHELRRDLDFVLVSMGKNAGKGSAIRRGLDHVTGEVVIIQDGDLEYDPRDIPAVVTPILEGKAEVVFGSRFFTRPDGMETRYYLGNRFFTMQANLLYAAHITDNNTGYKAFRTELLRDLHLTCRRFEFCAEVTAKVRRHGYQIHEVPISYRARNIEEGKKLSWRDAWQHFWYLLKFRFKPLR